MENPPPNRNEPAATRLQRRNRNVEDINQFGAVRDRLFHAMLVKVTLAYCKHVNPIFRRVIEFVSLLIALTMLGFLFFIHIMSSHASPTCLNMMKNSWHRDGVIRVEVIRNLESLNYKERWMSFYKLEKSRIQCHFNPRHVLIYGPAAMPAEVRQRQPQNAPSNGNYRKPGYKPFLNFVLNLSSSVLGLDDEEEEDEEKAIQLMDEEAEKAFNEHFASSNRDLPVALYRVEYALHYGLLRLSKTYRDNHDIPFVLLKVDSNHACFGDSSMRFALNNILGFEDAIMTSLRSLAANESSEGFLHNLNTGEHFHFVGNTMTKKSYITAAIVMFIFTFAISLLLRFSHHQIFMFIVDLLHMFELNQPLEFPAAPLLTVILALVGMEAIMSEVFADTSTAFYVILVVWIADQFDAICCHSSTSKQYWLRFFYLYQFFFYAYQYRFGGQFGGVALITSALFILHSMIFFFHHYEMPLILYQERVLRILSEIQSVPPMVPTQINSTTENSDQPSAPNQNASGGATTNNTTSDVSNDQNSTQPNQSSDNAESQADASAAPTTEEQIAQNVVSEALDELFNS